MVIRLRQFLPIALSWLLWIASADCRVVVNEIMANPTGGESSLKWIELYNDSVIGAPMIGWRIETSSGTILFPDSLIIQPFTYLVLCDQLISTAGDPGFESVWGNNSGVWGDTASEYLLSAPLEVPLLLVVQADFVRLYDSANQLESEATWNSSSIEGISLERIHVDSLSLYPCEDPMGATPLVINSITPMQYDLAIGKPLVGSSLGDAVVQFEISNRGFDTVHNATLVILADSADTIATFIFNELPPGASNQIDWNEQFNGMYKTLQAKLSADDRERNNAVLFTAPGSSFPPFLLSEIAPSERDGVLAEWIEIYRRSDTPWDISGWQLRTERGETVIAQFTELILEDYVVLTEDATRFQSSYPQVNAHLLEPDWVELINDHGIVSLYDPYGILADSFSYSDGNDVLIWSKVDTSLQSVWGTSSPLLGTPGAPNDVITASDSVLSLKVEPQILATDESGESTMEIIFTGPPDEAVTLKLFDKGGRTVKRFFDTEITSTRSVSWSGRDDDNRRLPIGMYILYLQAGTAKAIKQPVVIAR